MYIRTSHGPVWVSDEAPYFRDWQGRQLYKFHIAEPRSPQRAQHRRSSTRYLLTGGR
jgi:hypothetical protein